MSLFDAIRYPVNEIDNEEMLESLPDDLFDKWIKECNTNSLIMTSEDRYWLVYGMIESYSSAEAVKLPHVSLDVLRNIFKIKFKKILKRMIEEL